MNGPVMPLPALLPGETGEGRSYGDMYDGYYKDGPPVALHFKDAAIVPRPVNTVPLATLVEPIEVLRARVETNQLRGQPPRIHDDGTPPEIREIRRIIADNQRPAATNADGDKNAKPKAPGWCMP